MNRLVWLVFPWAAVLLAAGCVVRPDPVAVNAPASDGDYGTAYPSGPPPAPIAEYRPPPPGYGYVWVDGYWDWTGYDWTWNTGNWVPERQGYLYVRPRYVYESNHWVYHRSYWDGHDGRRDYDWGRPSPSGRGGARGPVAAPVVRGSAPGGPGVWGAPSRGPGPTTAAPVVRGAAPGPAYQQAPSRGWGQPQQGGTYQQTQPRPGYSPSPSPSAGSAAPSMGSRPGMSYGQPTRSTAPAYVPQGGPSAARGGPAGTMGGGAAIPTARGGAGAMGQGSRPAPAPSRPAPAQGGQIRRGRPPGM